MFPDEITCDFSALGAPVTTISRDAWCQRTKQAFAGWTATHHAISNLRIAIDGDRATIQAHIRAEHWAPPEVAAGEPNCWLVVGFYDDVAVRTPQGWQLSSVTLTLSHQENEALLEQVMNTEPYASARRVFWVVDNGSSHRGRRAVDRMQQRWPNARLVQLPVHASWLNQIEIYFSIVQRKVLTPNDFTDLADVETRLLGLERRYEQTATPFEWRFTRSDLAKLLERLADKPDYPAAA